MGDGGSVSGAEGVGPLGEREEGEGERGYSLSEDQTAQVCKQIQQVIGYYIIMMSLPTPRNVNSLRI